MASFEILHKDLAARIGRLHTPHGTVETPTIMPVINPNLLVIEPREMAKMGAEMLITNAYIIYKKEELREEALKRGVHSLLKWDKPLMTDSGSYQLYEYGDLEISNLEIIDFQIRIRSDIITPLDIPTPPFVSRRKALKDLEATLERMEEAKRLFSASAVEAAAEGGCESGGEEAVSESGRKESGEGGAKGVAKGKALLAGVVQGSTYLDLREESAKRLAAMQFDIYAIGGIVPLLELYEFGRIMDIIATAKMNLPLNAPVHLFGAGHPMFFSFAVALGCDLFDSAAYAIYAKDKRYLTSEGTLYAEDLNYLPCSCPVCASHSAREVRESVELLAAHNLYAAFEEMRVVKQSIVEGTLWELCERRARAHPSLMDALRRLTKYVDFIERLDPVTKHPFFYLSETCAFRPEVRRFARMLERFKLRGKVLLTTFPLNEGEAARRMEQEGYEHVLVVKPPFGAFPIELAETYPVGQSEIPNEIDEHAKEVALEHVLRLMRLNRDAKFFVECDKRWANLKKMEEVKKIASEFVLRGDDAEREEG
ncbi:MAG: tRNA guanosine(15) transglycosylase TgtA [Candidatus Methanospirare jalkutatii]|nr:tRNA guanosine(15) transglycosylase TgtA [Candidatus Methanospirare jalkutatii]